MANLKFKVRVVNKTKGELASRWFNYDIATSPAATNGGWVIEDPELDEKLKANGVTETKAEVKEQPKEAPKEEIKEDKPQEKSITDQVKEEVKESDEGKDDTEEAPDYDKMSFPELRAAAKHKGINSFGKKKVDIINELKGN